MNIEIPADLRHQVEDWSNLHRWERRVLAMSLRGLGMSYGEIRQLISVPKSTLSNWVSRLPLSADQVDGIRRRNGSDTRRGIPVDTQWKRRIEVEAIVNEARDFAERHMDDARFVGGVALYWGEGAKTRNYLDLANADPVALRAFIVWVREYLDPDARFVLSLHLHAGNDDDQAQRWWRRQLRMPDALFTKTFIKPPGTGHRKNHLEHGICRVRTRNASDHWNRVMVWIDVVGAHLSGVQESSRLESTEGR